MFKFVYGRGKIEINREKLFLISIFIFLLAFPYSVYGYFALFPDIFSVLAGYWIVTDRKNSYAIILIAGGISFLHILFGGDFLTSLLIIITALLASFFPDIFQPNLMGVIRVVFILSLFSSFLKVEPFFSGTLSLGFLSGDILKTIFFVFLRVLASLILSLAIYPLVYERKRNILL